MTLPSGIGRVGVMYACPLESVVPVPILLPFLSKISTLVFGSVDTSITVVVVALPTKSELIVGFTGGWFSIDGSAPSSGNIRPDKTV